LTGDRVFIVKKGAICEERDNMLSHVFCADLAIFKKLPTFFIYSLEALPIKALSRFLISYFY